MFIPVTASCNVLCETRPKLDVPFLVESHRVVGGQGGGAASVSVWRCLALCSDALPDRGLTELCLYALVPEVMR